MKKYILSILLLGFILNSHAQDDSKKQPSLGVHFFLNDFQTAAELRQSGLTDVIKNNQWSNLNRMTPGLSVSYMEGITGHLDFAGIVSGSFVNYPIAGKPDFFKNH